MKKTSFGKNEVIGTTQIEKSCFKYSHGKKKLITLYMLIEVMSREQQRFSTNQISNEATPEKMGYSFKLRGGKHQHSFLHTSTFELHCHK